MAPPPRTGRTAVNGLDFSHPPSIRPEQLSPRSTSSSSESLSESEVSDVSEGPNAAAAGRSPSPATGRRSPAAPPTPPARTRIVVQQGNFDVEELTELDDDYNNVGINVVRPSVIEDAESDRSRSNSRTRPEIDQKMMFNLNNLNCSDDSDISLDDEEFEEFLKKRRAERRHKRMTSGSIGKRTISESIGSDTDLEDIRSFNAEQAGCGTRRLRRRIGDRRSLQFQDAPPPRIDELDEPGSSEDEILIGESLARELPYYEYVSMEVDSP